MLPKASAYIKRYIGQTKWIYFLNEDDDLLGLFRIKPVLTPEFESKPAHNFFFFKKNKIKSHAGEFTNF